MTVLEVIKRTTYFFAKKGIDSPRLQIELLLGHILQLPRMKLYLNFERELTGPQLEQLRDLVKRRANREPLQHIIGQTNFCGLEIKSTSAALVPRPETEGLAIMARQFLQDWPGDKAILEIGAGTGCISIALAAAFPDAKIVSIDLSTEALSLAAENAAAHNVKIDFRHGNAFEAVQPAEKFALIISNPPYIPTAEIAELAPEVREFDPALALDGGADGLDFYRLIAVKGLQHIVREGRVMVEFGDEQHDAVQGIFASAGWGNPSLTPDLSGTLRYFSATAPD